MFTFVRSAACDALPDLLKRRGFHRKSVPVLSPCDIRPRSYLPSFRYRNIPRSVQMTTNYVLYPTTPSQNITETAQSTLSEIAEIRGAKPQEQQFWCYYRLRTRSQSRFGSSGWHQERCESRASSSISCNSYPERLSIYRFYSFGAGALAAGHRYKIRAIILRKDKKNEKPAQPP